MTIDLLSESGGAISARDWDKKSTRSNFSSPSQSTITSSFDKKQIRLKVNKILEGNNRYEKVSS